MGRRNRDEWREDRQPIMSRRGWLALAAAGAAGALLGRNSELIERSLLPYGEQAYDVIRAFGTDPGDAPETAGETPVETTAPEDTPTQPAAPTTPPPAETLSDTYFPTFGIDTAKYQFGTAEDGFDRTELLAQGISYQIHRATRGMPGAIRDLDPNYADNRERAKAAKLLFGAYHFLETGEAAAQADRFVTYLQQTGGTDNLICCLDVETYEDHDGATKGPNYDDVLAFNQRFHELIPDRPLVAYIGAHWWGDVKRAGALNNPPAPPGTVLWQPHYLPNELRGKAPNDYFEHISKPGAPDDAWPSRAIGTYSHYAFRQFTSGAIVRHMNPIDLNISFLPFDQLRRLAGPNVDAVEATPLAKVTAMPRAGARTLESLIAA